LTPTEERVAAMRRFNRFYTRQIGVLDEHLLRSELSLTEVRVLYELAHREQPTATALRKELGLDAGYLSRILAELERRGLVKRMASETDGRQSVLALTASGKRAFAALDERSQEEVRALLGRLPPGRQRSLVEAMRVIERALGADAENPAKQAPYLLRPHQPGDLGWVVHRHGVIYAQEQGWDDRFEALVARVAADFIDRFDPRRERCWIAEREGDIVGSVCLVQKSKTVAQLRLLLVEPSARGLGIGGRLVDECVRFARQVGYRKIMLWTNAVLMPARRLYERAGFQLMKQGPSPGFGGDEQTWELVL
jgi:DNA-binding MarR family transcriptional regulator/GNAT superfamily N-acetyltransferase